MKILCGIFGMLFVFLANFLPVPDPGLATALLASGGSLCISALALELHPFLAELTEEAEIPHLRVQHERPEQREDAPHAAG